MSCKLFFFVLSVTVSSNATCCSFYLAPTFNYHPIIAGIDISSKFSRNVFTVSINLIQVLLKYFHLNS